MVSEYGGTNVWTFLVNADGGLSGGERSMTLVVPAGRKDSGGDGATVDHLGRTYVTSHAGIQMFDWTGRLGGVIGRPEGKAMVSCAFAGLGREYLYVCAGDAIFRRKTLTHAADIP
jgi:sugar lactone lactonase YvrE